MEGSVMRRYLKFTLFVLLLIIVPTHVKAYDFLDECDYSTKAKLKRLASNINTSYTPIETDNSLSFNVTISNIYPSLIVMDGSSGNEYHYDVSRKTPYEVTITGLKADQTYRYEVYSDVENCTEEMLAVYYVTLPAYNPYYKDELCKGYEDYKLCNRWLKHSLTYEEFVSEMTKYKESLNQQDEEIEENIQLNPLLQFIKDYYYVFIGLGILGIGYIIYVRRKRDSFGF